MRAAAAAPASTELRPAREMSGELAVPADKSIAHRALILGALAEGRSTIVVRHPGEDVLSTLAALRALGVRAEAAGDEPTTGHEPTSGEPLPPTSVRIDGLGQAGHAGRLGGGQADCGNSGTTMRLLMGALAGGAGEVVLTGDASLSRRPMERVAEPLRRMGAEVATTDGRPPVTILGRRPLAGVNHELSVASAQVLGALVLAALAADGRTAITVPGPTRDHTERMLSAMGVPLSRSGRPRGASVTTVDGPSVPRPMRMTVPGDFSSAAAWVVAAAIHPAASVRLANVGLNPTRVALLDALREMGAGIEATVETEQAGEPIGTISVSSRGGPLRALRVGPELVPALIDELPLLAVAMAAAEGTSEVRGAQELRVKESDRIAAVAAALTAVGANVEELPDGWRIRRGRPREATIATRGDHRLAISLAVAAWAGVAAGVRLDDPACVAVSYPTFWRDAQRLGLGGPA